MTAMESALRALEGNFSTTLQQLVSLARVKGISAAGFPAVELERSAESVAQAVRSSGLEHVEILRIPGAHPYVVGDWLHAGASAPTALVYAHHDVQPPGRPEKWLTPAFEPSMRSDGRLYGRGVVDDKAGVLLHLAAQRAWLAAAGALPVNEIGRAHV